MHLTSQWILASALAMTLLPVHAVAADDKERVLRQMDAAAARFHNTTADFQFKSIQTDPVPDEDTQEGTVYYERSGASFRMAGHIRKVDGKPITKIYTWSKGVLQLYEKTINQITIFKTSNNLEGYLMLGFGASGKDLADKWDIKYLGPETLADGNLQIKTEKLELVAKDPDVRKNIPKVTIWVDTERGVSLKQVFEEGSGQYRVSVYFNIKVNQPLPADAFTFKTDGKTVFVNR